MTVKLVDIIFEQKRVSFKDFNQIKRGIIELRKYPKGIPEYIMEKFPNSKTILREIHIHSTNHNGGTLYSTVDSLQVNEEDEKLLREGDKRFLSYANFYFQKKSRIEKVENPFTWH